MYSLVRTGALHRAIGMRALRPAVALPSAARGSRPISTYAKQGAAFFQQYWPQIAAGSGAVVVLYGVTSASIHVSSFLLHLDALTTLRVGMGIGFASCLVMAGGGWYAWRRTILNAKTVQHLALEKLAASKLVRTNLGEHLRVGELQAYREIPGHWSIEKKMAWVEPRVHMLFQVHGDSAATGFVSAEAVKRMGTSVDLTMLAVDTSKGQVLLVVGDEAKLHKKSALRGFLQSERAAYIPQDASETDEEYLREQEAVALHNKIGRV